MRKCLIRLLYIEPTIPLFDKKRSSVKIKMGLINYKTLYSPPWFVLESYQAGVGYWCDILEVSSTTDMILFRKNLDKM